MLGLTAACFGVLLLASCSEKAERVAADEVAEQMEADRKGREAAKKIVGQDWPDTMQLQMALLDARAQSSAYEIEGKQQCQARFDSSFVNTVRTVRPDLAKKLGY